MTIINILVMISLSLLCYSMIRMMMSARTYAKKDKSERVDRTYILMDNAGVLGSYLVRYKLKSVNEDNVTPQITEVKIINTAGISGNIINHFAAGQLDAFRSLAIQQQKSRDAHYSSIPDNVKETIKQAVEEVDKRSSNEIDDLLKSLLN